MQLVWLEPELAGLGQLVQAPLVESLKAMLQLEYSAKQEVPQEPGLASRALRPVE